MESDILNTEFHDINDFIQLLVNFSFVTRMWWYSIRHIWFHVDVLIARKHVIST